MFSEPQKIIDQFGLKEGDSVADLGAGSGAYSFAVARKVKDTGRVYAIDVQRELIAKIKSGAREQNLDNIEIIWGDIEKDGGSKLGDETVEAVIIANILFLAEDKKAVIKEAVRILKPGGKALLVDWTDSFGGLGPAKDMVLHFNKAREMFEQNSLVFQRDIEAGGHHYGAIFKK